MITPLFARQAIFNKHLQVAAYELLFRGKPGVSHPQFDGDKASCDILKHAFGKYSISDITGHRDAFINFTRNLLVYPPELPASQLVIEVLEDTQPDPELLQALGKLKDKGYRIALDDFLLTEHSKQLLPFADIIKIDILQLDEAKLREHIQELKSYNSELKFIAEKVETHEQFALCSELDFDYFQGYFLSRPQLVEKQDKPAGQHSTIQKLYDTTSSSARFKSLAQVCSADPGLSFRLLKMMNSPAFYSGEKVNSLSEAIALVGQERIRNWAALLLLNQGALKPSELYIINNTRARFCELLALKAQCQQPGQAFIVGALSMMDAHFDLPMPELLNYLELPEATERILQSNTEGKQIKNYDNQAPQHVFLLTCQAIERQAWSDIPIDYLNRLAITDEDINNAYTEALLFAQAIESL